MSEITAGQLTSDHIGCQFRYGYIVARGKGEFTITDIGVHVIESLSHRPNGKTMIFSENGGEVFLSNIEVIEIIEDDLVPTLKTNKG